MGRGLNASQHRNAYRSTTLDVFWDEIKMSGELGPVAIPVISERAVSPKEMQKMVFICNAVEDGWQVVKKTDTYVFTKKHEGRKEVFREGYLAEFIARNLALRQSN